MDVDYDNLCQKLRQHEQTITQLLSMIAVNNRKITDLNKRQLSLEQKNRNSPRSPHTNAAKELSSIPSDAPYVKE